MFQPGEVRVVDITMPDREPVMQTAATIVARELAIPAAVGAEHATEQLIDGRDVTVSWAEGDTRLIYAGMLPFQRETNDLSGIKRPTTHIMINLGNPDLAFPTSLLPYDGVASRAWSSS